MPSLYFPIVGYKLICIQCQSTPHEHNFPICAPIGNGANLGLITGASRKLDNCLSALIFPLGCKLKGNPLNCLSLRHSIRLVSSVLFVYTRALPLSFSLSLFLVGAMCGSAFLPFRLTSKLNLAFGLIRGGNQQRSKCPSQRHGLRRAWRSLSSCQNRKSPVHYFLTFQHSSTQLTGAASHVTTFA